MVKYIVELPDVIFTKGKARVKGINKFTFDSLTKAKRYVEMLRLPYKKQAKIKRK